MRLLHDFEILQQPKNTEIMKKLMLSLLLVALPLAMLAQKEVTIKAGTIVPLVVAKHTETTYAVVGETVDFRVSQDVNVDGVCAIPQGTIVKGKVTKARKSTIAGVRGKLVVDIPSLRLENGELLYFSNSQVCVYGKSRIACAVVSLFCLWPLILVPGTKAVLPEGYEVHATVAANTTISVK